MGHFSWKWVGLINSDNDQSTQFLSDLKEKMQINEIYSAFVNVIPRSRQLYMLRAEMYYNQIETSKANVVIVYGNMDSTLAWSIKMWEHLSTRRIWVTTSQLEAITSKQALIHDPFHVTFIFFLINFY